jgi:hypothetical protein
LHADQRHSGTSARQRVEREWYPAIATELDPKVMDWLDLPDRIVKPVGVEVFGLG